ncbi:hypothetical protein [Streptosporangium carneum]|uniref:Uncharacterized protein n=1 Tax=Streptosporangium carneum TaxID=47481 RepID=A0A9W6ICN3_9ACTN|nr:hypothetical protein [Streptosporangium carneum]GLK15254.1 hypothetical protein GCM10017600_86670 [Streptosporangium carneum]
MSTLEDGLRQIMADETERLHAAPDLADRVLRSSRRKTKRVRLTALAAAATVAAAVVPAYLVLGQDSTAVRGGETGGMVATSVTSQPDAASAAPEPPAIDDTPEPDPTATPDLGDLGDGRAFGHVRVGYLPEGLQWSHWSLDFGDRYTTSWNYDGDKNGFYCVQIYVYEGQAVQEVEERLRMHREVREGEEVTLGGRAGYLIRQGVGEDGGDGTPTVFVDMGGQRWAEVMFSPVYAKEFDDADAIARELRKVAEGLTAAA